MMRAPEFWRRRGPLALLLAPLGMLYGMSVAWKAHHARPYRAKARVICVGNLTAGGSGKTPAALAIGAHLQAQGYKVFFLTRGYGGALAGPLRVSNAHRAQNVGDEALLLARTAPTIVARGRAAGARMAESAGADIIIMDDGHQNFSLAKDLSLVVVDGESGFGNGLMIPAGPLRESVNQGLARADTVLVMNDGHPDLGNYRGVVMRARLVPDGATLKGQHVFRFCHGIGRPERFIASLRQAGAIIAGQRFFADHHVFQESEIAALRKDAGGAQLITTEKDFMRLVAPAAIAVLKVRAEFEDALGHLLDRRTRPV